MTSAIPPRSRRDPIREESFVRYFRDQELFNAAFYSCWSELAGEGPHQASLVASLESALDSEHISPEVTRTKCYKE